MKDIDTKKITRFEVIDHRNDTKEKGRIIVAYNAEVELQVQDEGRTLKVFIKNKQKEELKREWIKKQEEDLKLKIDKSLEVVFGYTECTHVVFCLAKKYHKNKIVKEVKIELPKEFQI